MASTTKRASPLATSRRIASAEIELAGEMESRSESHPDRSLDATPSPYRRREIIQNEGEQSSAVRRMKTKARASHRRASRRSSLAGRIDDEP